MDSKEARIINFLYGSVQEDEIGVRCKRGTFDRKIISSFVFDSLNLSFKAPGNFANPKRSVCSDGETLNRFLWFVMITCIGVS